MKIDISQIAELTERGVNLAYELSQDEKASSEDWIALKAGCLDSGDLARLLGVMEHWTLGAVQSLYRPFDSFDEADQLALLVANKVCTVALRLQARAHSPSM